MRHRSRHVLQTVVQHLDDQLSVLGWMTPGGFKTATVTLVPYMLDDTDKSLPPNTVAVNLGDEGEELPEELGDGLLSLEYTAFIDIYGENQAVALALADDVKDIFRGRISGLSPHLALRDFTNVGTGVIDTTSALEFSLTERTKPVNNDYRRNWQVVKTTITCYFVPGA